MTTKHRRGSLTKQQQDDLDHKLMDDAKRKAKGVRIKVTGPVDEYIMKMGA